MRSASSLLLALLIAQAAYVLPSPTGKNDTITLYINVAQTTDGVQNSGLNARLNAHPDDSVYLVDVVTSLIPLERQWKLGQFESKR
jgi:hypothetical protein